MIVFFLATYSDWAFISGEVVCSPTNKAPSKTNWEPASKIILNIIQVIKTCILFFVPQLNLCAPVIPLPPKMAVFDIAMRFPGFSRQ